MKLPARLYRVLRCLRDAPNRYANAAMIHGEVLVFESEPVKLTAINNRLEKLRALGLVKRERSGKHWFYQPTKSPKQ